MKCVIGQLNLRACFYIGTTAICLVGIAAAVLCILYWLVVFCTTQVWYIAVPVIVLGMWVWIGLVVVCLQLASAVLSRLVDRIER